MKGQIMNIIIVGCGKVGEKIALSLCLEKEHNITVIDTRSEIINSVSSRYDVMGVVGNGASIDTLYDAGVKDADILIAVTGSDELNLLTCLIARKTGHCQTIARVRNPEYSKEINVFKEDLGLAMIINPELTAAMEIARVLRFPAAINIDTFAGGRVEILKFKICDNSPLNNLAVSDITHKLNCDVLVCGVQRNDKAFIPHGDFVLKTGDFVSIVGSLKNVSVFFKKIGIKSGKTKNCMIVGGGEIGYYLARLLLKTGIDVKIIEQDINRCNRLCELLPKATIINGDGSDNKLLLEEGVERADAFVSLTNIDEENIILSLFAKTLTNGKIVTKINRIAFDDVISTLDIGTTLYPKNLTADYIVRFVRAKNNTRGSNIETMHMILNDKAEALEFRITENSPIANKPIESLNLKNDIIIACINRNGKIIIPRGHDVISPNDTVIVATTITGLKDITDIFD